LLIHTERLTLVPRLRSERSSLGPRHLLLLSTPCSLLCLVLALLTPLRFSPGSKHAAALPSRHRSSSPGTIR
jgi:hypothetical protein